MLFKKGTAKLSNKYDCISIHFILPSYANIITEVLKLSRNIVVTVWGSDFLRVSDSDREKQRAIYDKARLITFNNPVVMEKFKKYYKNYMNKCIILRFGIGCLRTINRINGAESRHEILRKLNMSTTRIVVMAGYNAVKEQQHFKILDAIALINPLFKDKICLVLSLTYPRDDLYIAKVIDYAKKCAVSVCVFKEMLSTDDLARLRLITDIVLNFQTTDSLSASIQEHAYCGARFIVGDWLPYGELENLGICFQKVESTEKMAFALERMLECNDQDYTKRKFQYSEAIKEFSSWENNLPMWIRAYSSS
jgi:hypothetical protein